MQAVICYQLIISVLMSLTHSPPIHIGGTMDADDWAVSTSDSSGPSEDEMDTDRPLIAFLSGLMLTLILFLSSYVALSAFKRLYPLLLARPALDKVRTEVFLCILWRLERASNTIRRNPIKQSNLFEAVSM